MIQWPLVALLIAFVLYLIVRLVGPLARGSGDGGTAEIEEPQWRPDERESLALLEDADRLAREGRFDEAARLLLKRSVGQIAEAKPDWVNPSSTARELSALPSLSQGARRAFGVMSAKVERSLFALKTLSSEDWDQARQAYADFALAPIGAAPTENSARP